MQTTLTSGPQSFKFGDNFNQNREIVRPFTERTPELDIRPQSFKFGDNFNQSREILLPLPNGLRSLTFAVISTKA